MHFLSCIARVALLFLIALQYCVPVSAGESTLRIELPGDHEIELQRFSASGDSLLLWLPSERGIRPAHRQHARTLAQAGHEVWLADLHDAYFVERNRNSIDQMPLDDVVGLIDAATQRSNADLVLISSSRGAQLALMAAREWQLKNPGQTRIKGIFLTHAYLYEGRPRVGSPARYLPIAQVSNLPIYLLDTQYSTRVARIGELADQLSQGGSQVFTQVLTGVQGGFFARDNASLSDADRDAKDRYASIIDRAVTALKRVSTPDSAPASDFDTRLFSRRPTQHAGLNPVENPGPSPALVLKDMDGRSYRLDEHRGKVVLVNFWASWCRPCVEEIPSLHRLHQKVGDPVFEIVTVNVGENRERITRFLERVPIDLPLLMDRDGEVHKAWQVYVYPSSYLIDQHGKIRYAYLGALEWDSPDNITIIQNLLNQH